jgi:hypothetical protein
MVGRVLLLLAAGASLLGDAWAKGAAPTCRTDSDCVLVPADCCGCNKGGKQRAIPRKNKATYQRAQQSRCKDTLCPEVMSQDPSCSARTAVCREQTCTLSD